MARAAVVKALGGSPSLVGGAVASLAVSETDRQS